MRPQSAVGAQPSTNRVVWSLTELSQQTLDRVSSAKGGLDHLSKNDQLQLLRIKEAELRKRKRKEHLKNQYESLLQQYACIDTPEVREQKRRNPIGEYRGLEVFKLLARKEEEFDSETTAEYNSRKC